MHTLESNPNIGMDFVPDHLGVLQRWRWAGLFSNLAVDSQQSYIERGTTRIDEDPRPGTLGDIARRVKDDFRGKLYVAAFELDATVQTNDPLKHTAGQSDALKGMAVFDAEPGVFEVYECNVRSDSKEQKIARAMLILGAHFIPEGWKVIADVHEDNPAQEMWKHLSFVWNQSVAPVEKGVFKGKHRQYQTSAEEFRASLGLTNADSFHTFSEFW